MRGFFIDYKHQSCYNIHIRHKERRIIIKRFFEEDYKKDIPKYKKRRRRRKIRRSNHKHIYVDMLIKRKSGDGYWYNYGKVCEICGRIGEEKYFETEELDRERCYRYLTQEEILEKYKRLPIFKKKDT